MTDVRYMRSRALVGAYWRLARDLARAFGARYVLERHLLATSGLTLRRYGDLLRRPTADDREALPPYL